MLCPEEDILLYHNNVNCKITQLHKGLFLYNVKNQEEDIALQKELIHSINHGRNRRVLSSKNTPTNLGTGVVASQNPKGSDRLVPAWTVACTPYGKQGPISPLKFWSFNINSWSMTFISLHPFITRATWLSGWRSTSQEEHRSSFNSESSLAFIPWQVACFPRVAASLVTLTCHRSLENIAVTASGYLELSNLPRETVGSQPLGQQLQLDCCNFY